MTLYAIHPDPGSGSLDDGEVVDKSRYGWDFLQQAIALWRLVDPARADAIAAVKARAENATPDEPTRFGGADLAELARLLAGVDEAIVGAGVVDDKWRVPADRLDELAARVPGMDLTSERSLDSKRHALGEVMMNAISLHNFLADAARAGCVVVHD
jgi:hypothetical protein